MTTQDKPSAQNALANEILSHFDTERRLSLPVELTGVNSIGEGP
jgi:hypothetical protein